jgi:RNA polymerase sigma-70 factor, ECF subfamily
MRGTQSNIGTSMVASIGTLRAEASVTPRERLAHTYREERGPIYRYLVALGTNPVEAQDLTQEAFLKLYIAIRKGKQIENTRAWLFTVASNLSLNQKRSQGYRPAATENEMARWLESQADPDGDPEQTLLQSEKALSLGQAIGTLSRQQQACLHLRAEGFRYREIAQILGVKLPTVAEFVRRAIARLKRVMHE